jgi:hypothetical protein
MALPFGRNITRCCRLGLLRQRNGRCRDVAFGLASGPGKLLDDSAVVITGFKIHPAVNTGRILGQGVVNQAGGFEKPGPILGIQRAKAQNAGRRQIGQLISGR